MKVGQSIRTSLGSNQVKRHNSGAARLEQMESRQLLSTVSFPPANWQYSLSGNDTINVVSRTYGGNTEVEFTQVGAGTYIVTVTPFGDPIDAISIDAGAGNDTINAANYFFARATLIGGTGDDSVQGSTQIDSMLGGDGDDTFIGSSGNDTIFGEGGNDSIDGGAGADSLEGSAGTDSIVGGPQSDIILGGGDADTLRGSGGLDTLVCGDGSDSAYGDTDADQFSGGTGDDQLFGGDGNDFAEAGAGNDTLWGDAGQDNLYGNEGNDVLRAVDPNVADFVLRGGPDSDTAYFDSPEDSAALNSIETQLPS